MEYMRQLLLLDLQTLLDHDASLLVHGPKNSAHRLPNTLSIGIKGINSNILLNNIGKHVAASAGAACHSSSDSPRISNVLLAMNIEGKKLFFFRQICIYINYMMLIKKFFIYFFHSFFTFHLMGIVFITKN